MIEYGWSSTIDDSAFRLRRENVLGDTARLIDCKEGRIDWLRGVTGLLITKTIEWKVGADWLIMAEDRFGARQPPLVNENKYGRSSDLLIAKRNGKKRIEWNVGADWLIDCEWCQRNTTTAIIVLYSRWTPLVKGKNTIVAEKNKMIAWWVACED